MMLKCWQENPNERPDFLSLVNQLEREEKKIYIDFNEIDPDYVFPPANNENLQINLC